MEFRIKIREDRDLFFKCVKAVESLHGERVTRNVNHTLVWNDNFKTQAMPGGKCRRIYLKNESEVSLILLKASVL